MHRLTDSGRKKRICPGAGGRRRDHAQQRLTIWINERQLIVGKWIAAAWVKRTVGGIRDIANIGEIPLAVGDRGNRSEKILRNVFPPPFLGPEEEGMLLPDRTSERITEVVFLVGRFGRSRGIKVVVRIKRLVAQKFIHRTVDLVPT